MSRKKLLVPTFLLAVTGLFNFSLVAQPTAGLLCHFKLDGNTTNTGPASVTASAISTSYTTNNANAPAKALQFGGSLTSLIDFTDNGNLDFAGTANFTVSFSFFFNGSTTGGLIDNCLNYGGWGIWLWSTVAGTWNLQFNYKNNSVGSAAATAFTIGTWHHVAAVRNNGTISLYIDGAFRLSATEGTTAPTYPINMIAGAMAYGGYTPPRYNPFGGKIDEIRVYNRALSAAEIITLAPYSLPVKMGEFTAVKKTTGIQLHWETLTEQNTSHFDIERSTDGANFYFIGRVNAAGNTVDKKAYQFLDATPAPGTNFYRLKMADIDGKSSFSAIVAVKNTAALLTLELFPNPVSDLLQVQLSAADKEKASLSITDAAGKILYQKTIQLEKGNNGVSIPVLQLPKGLYYLVFSKSTGSQSKQFIKQ
jgi:hypothetical protein